MRRLLLPALFLGCVVAACKIPPIPLPVPSPTPHATPCPPIPTPEPPPGPVCPLPDQINQRTCGCWYWSMLDPRVFEGMWIYAGDCAPTPSPSPVPTPTPTPTPEPTPAPYPDHCPRMACWKPQQTLFGPGDLKVGNKITLDSTEFFEVCLPRGRCEVNGVNVTCGGRPCEDPRGTRWYQKAGPKIDWWQVQANESGNDDPSTGYQLQIKIPARGTYTLCVEPLDDLRDHLGQAVVAMPGAGRCTTFTVP